MFRCQSCETVVPPRTSATRVVVKSRERVYPVRETEKVTGRRRTRQVEDRGGSGREIARELVICPACAEKYETN